MVSNTIKAGILAVTALFTTQAHASEHQQKCEVFATMTYKVGKLRDMGYTPEIVLYDMTEEGVPEGIATALLTLVYIEAPHLSAVEVANGFYTTCLKREQTY